MTTERNYRFGIAEIDYSRDTLFGPIPMQATCRVKLATVEQDGKRLRELTIIGELPDHLLDSAVIRVALQGQIEAGPIRDHCAGVEEGFRLLFENNRKRSMH